MRPASGAHRDATELTADSMVDVKPDMQVPEERRRRDRERPATWSKASCGDDGPPRLANTRRPRMEHAPRERRRALVARIVSWHGDSLGEIITVLQAELPEMFRDAGEVDLDRRFPLPAGHLCHTRPTGDETALMTAPRICDLIMLGTETDMLECRLREFEDDDCLHVVMEPRRRIASPEAPALCREQGAFRPLVRPDHPRHCRPSPALLTCGRGAPWITEHAQRDRGWAAVEDQVRDSDVVLIADVDQSLPLKPWKAPSPSRP